MNFSEIKELIQIINSSDLRSFDINFEGVSISMSKNENGEVKASAPMASVQQTVSSVAAAVVAEEKVVESVKAPAASAGNVIKSPIVGTFYSSAKPGSPAIKSKGDRVKKGEVICIVEAMKIMNEITSEYDGIVDEILVENEQLVEFGQPLFRIV